MCNNSLSLATKLELGQLILKQADDERIHQNIVIITSETVYTKMPVASIIIEVAQPALHFQKPENTHQMYIYDNSRAVTNTIRRWRPNLLNFV